MASYNCLVLFLACLMAPKGKLFLFNGGVTVAVTSTVSWNESTIATTTETITAKAGVTATAATTAATAGVPCPTPPTCSQCPVKYRSIQEHTYGCNYRCLCELVSSTSTAIPAAAKPSLSKSILLSVLHNIQNNAAALEQMALGLSEEANIAQMVANNTSI